MADLDKVQVRMLMDWSDQPPGMLIEEELRKLQQVVETAVDEHYGNNDTLDLTLVTHEGKQPRGAADEGWTLDENEMWDRIPGDTREEKLRWLEEHNG